MLPESPRLARISGLARAIVMMSANEREIVLRAKSGVRTLFLGDRRVDGDRLAEQEAPRLRAALRRGIAEALESTGQSLASTDDLTALTYEAATAVYRHDRPADDDVSTWAADWRRLVAPFGDAVL